MSVQDEPDTIQREVKGGRGGVAGAVDGLGLFVTAEHLDRLILHAFAMNFDDRVGAMHVGCCTQKAVSRVKTSYGAFGPSACISSALTVTTSVSDAAGG